MISLLCCERLCTSGTCGCLASILVRCITFCCKLAHELLTSARLSQLWSSAFARIALLSIAAGTLVVRRAVLLLVTSCGVAMQCMAIQVLADSSKVRCQLTVSGKAFLLCQYGRVF